MVFSTTMIGTVLWYAAWHDHGGAGKAVNDRMPDILSEESALYLEANVNQPTSVTERNSRTSTRSLELPLNLARRSGRFQPHKAMPKSDFVFLVKAGPKAKKLVLGIASY